MFDATITKAIKNVDLFTSNFVFNYFALAKATESIGSSVHNSIQIFMKFIKVNANNVWVNIYAKTHET